MRWFPLFNLFLMCVTCLPTPCCLGGCTATLVPSSFSTARRRGHGESTRSQVCGGSGGALRRRLFRLAVTALRRHMLLDVSPCRCVCATCGPLFAGWPALWSTVPWLNSSRLHVPVGVSATAFGFACAGLFSGRRLHVCDSTAAAGGWSRLSQLRVLCRCLLLA